MTTNTDSENSAAEDAVPPNEENFVRMMELMSRLEEAVANANESAAAALKSSNEAAASQLAVSETYDEIGLIKAALNTAKDAATTAVTGISKTQDEVETTSENASTLLTEMELNKKSSADVATDIAKTKATVDALMANVTTAADQIQALFKTVEPSKSAIDNHTQAIEDASDEATESNNRLKALANKAQEAEAKVASYEIRLAELEIQYAQQLKIITELVPGAGSAGLAYAFEKRQRTFFKPAAQWQKLFIGTVIALIVIAGTGALQVFLGGHTFSYEELLRVWIIRLPIAGGLIWLALHASHEAALAKRLEEDYGYKSTIAASFLGFHNHLMKIKDEFKDTPLEKLCSDTLGIIATPPGRIYEKHELTTSLTVKIGEAVASALTSHIPKPPTAS